MGSGNRHFAILLIFPAVCGREEATGSICWVQVCYCRVFTGPESSVAPRYSSAKLEFKYIVAWKYRVIYYLLMALFYKFVQ